VLVKALVFRRIFSKFSKKLTPRLLHFAVFCKSVSHLESHLSGTGPFFNFKTRSIIMYLEMDDNTWNQLLIILVHITRALLKGEQQNGSLASNVTSPLIQTLIVAWIKASLYAAVSTELWNDMLELSHEMTHLALMITEWAKTMKESCAIL